MDVPGTSMTADSGCPLIESSTVPETVHSVVEPALTGVGKIRLIAAAIDNTAARLENWIVGMAPLQLYDWLAIEPASLSTRRIDGPAKPS
jgi:hypothetical protein